MDIDRLWAVLAGTVNEYPLFCPATYIPFGSMTTLAVGVPSAHERENVELLKYAL